MDAGAPAFYRCEICHFRYQFRQPWWARLVGHPLTSGLILLLVLGASSWLLGYAPLIEPLLGELRSGRPLPAWSLPPLHLLDGLLLVDWAGMVTVLLLAGEDLAEGPYAAFLARASAVSKGAMLAVAASCFSPTSFYATSLAVMGAFTVAATGFLCVFLYGALHAALGERMRRAARLVEDVGAGHRGSGSRRMKRTRGSEGGGEVGGGGGGGCGTAGRQRRWFRRAGRGAAAPAAETRTDASAAGVAATVAPPPAAVGPSGPSSILGEPVATPEPPKDDIV